MIVTLHGGISGPDVTHSATIYSEHVSLNCGELPLGNAPLTHFLTYRHYSADGGQHYRLTAIDDQPLYSEKRGNFEPRK